MIRFGKVLVFLLAAVVLLAVGFPSLANGTPQSNSVLPTTQPETSSSGFYPNVQSLISLIADIDVDIIVDYLYTQLGFAYEKRFRQATLADDHGKQDSSKTLHAQFTPSLSIVGINAWQDDIVSIYSQLYPNTKTSIVLNTRDQRFSPYTVVIATGTDSRFGRQNLFPIDQIRVSLLRSSEPNAFSVPADAENGSPARIVLSQGLFDLIKARSELAFIIAHEMVHLKHDHFMPHLPSAMFTERQLAHMATTHQGWEFTADEEARTLLAKHGFEDYAAVELLERLANLQTQSLHTFFLRHPAIQQRLARLRVSIADNISLLSVPPPY